ncbi:hypothetical protein ACJIZ3_022845 [Penstemon smallii]|uniref:C2 NT-type domain-containing protein n=1 Tax=Penstemon smallii TaxID=265156 RepID=A0ABD3TME3_9LAMI
MVIREKILRQKPSSVLGTHDASAEKIDFTFSNIKALQVPKGWDQLCISILSSETGKTVVTKTAKGSVKNGTCQWTETLSESIWITNNVDSYIFKFLVAMGFSRTGILGEATLDLSSFLSSESPMLVSLPLRNCNYGTILQVEIMCLNPIPNLRDEKWRNMHAYTNENAEEEEEDVENKSEISDCTTAKSVESRQGELGSRERSVFSFSRYSFDSMDGSVGSRQSISSQSNLYSTKNYIGRQDSTESHDSYSTSDSPISLHQDSGSSKTFKETDYETVEVLKAEARMWEKNARKLRIDVENLRKELSDQCLNMTDLNMELASSRLECQKRIQEIEDLKSPSQNVSENYEFHERTRSNLLKEFEDEMRFQKESNRNLSLQLRKTQESNLELISLLQEMEETVEITLQDRTIEAEIEQYIKNLILKDFEVECNSLLVVKEQEVEHLKEKVHELETDFHELTEENVEIQFQLKELQKSVSKSSKMSFSSSSHISSISCISDDGIHEQENEIEEENVYLSQRISGLEAHLRYVTEEMESSRLVLQHSESQATILKIEIKSLEEEIESQKLSMKHKLREVENKWSEAQEVCRNLSKVNIKLQATTESLMEEYNLLQEFNGELREQKLKLQSKCIFLEAEVRKFQDSLNMESSEISSSKTRLSEVERLIRLEEENYILHRKLEKVPELQNEVLALRLSLDEMKSKNQIMEASLKSLSSDNEELERVNNSMFHKIINLQMEISETENCQRKSVALEEKVLRLEGDLIARDALCVLGAETKNELNQMKRANSELQRKVQSLEIQNQLQVLKLSKEEDDGSMSIDQDPEMNYESRIQILEKELVEALEANDMYKLQLQNLHEVASMTQKSSEVSDGKISRLEADLKYAEVEDQREELVMKLKTLNSCSSFSQKG